MKKRYGFMLFVLPVFLISGLSLPSFPETKISNGLIQVRIYLPDGDRGYYRSTRFDWSGVMPDIEYKGHTFCGQWFDRYDPTTHDAVMGPVESFSPLGYDETKTKESFTQIGVGRLQKPDSAGYSPFHYYKIIDPGVWHIQKSARQVVFTHNLTSGEYPYAYTKTISLVKNQPEMVLAHALKNTGHKPIEVAVYDHNLFLIDHQPIGPDCVIKFSFDVSGEKQNRQGIGTLATIGHKQITFLRSISQKEHAYAILQGYDHRAKDYDIRMENHKTGAGVGITSDRPLSKLIFWASSTAFCPEPYIHIKINPNEVFHWKIRYQFYTLDTVNHP